MSRNQNSHFARVPRANIPRSKFDISNRVLTTGNAGKLIPIEHWEVLAGDTFSVDLSMLARMQTLITPLMDDMYADVYFFYAPNRLLWEHWEEFCGDDEMPWFDERPEYSVPQHEFSILKEHPNAIGKGTVADYMGWPLPIYDQDEEHTESIFPNIKVSALPLRMYTRVWNEWFKSESLQNNAAFSWSDSGTEQKDSPLDPTYGTALEGGPLLPVNKYRDYFTSCLPAPQYNGNTVTIGVGDLAPVFAGSAVHSLDTLKHGDNTAHSLAFKHNTGDNFAASTYYNVVAQSDAATEPGGPYEVWTKNGATMSAPSGSKYMTPANLYADISAATGISVNELRMAFATQRYYEAIARHGSRYTEWLAGIWGVTSPDSRLQRTEYLGGTRVHINVNQVIQNSETNTTPLGNVGAYSLTTNSQDMFTKSFVEPGILMCFCCVRYDHSYQDGIDPQDDRKDFFDYYNPLFARLGETGVKNKYIFADGSYKDEEIFGYQEYAAEYRFKNNHITGEMRSRYDLSLDYWHLGDNYAELPKLGQDWIKEDGSVVDRALAVSQRVSDQFLFDFWFNVKATRPMPLYSVPGLDVL